MTTPVNEPDWVSFVHRCQKVIASRKPGSPVLMIVCNEADEGEYFTHVIAHDLQDHHRIPIIGQLIASFAQARPDLPEAVELREAFHRVFGATAEIHDVSNGMK